MLDQRLRATLVGFGDNELRQIVTERTQQLACLVVGPLVKNLTEVSQPINPGHEHAEAWRLPDDLRNALATVGGEALDARDVLESKTQFFLVGA